MKCDITGDFHHVIRAVLAAVGALAVVVFLVVYVVVLGVGVVGFGLALSALVTGCNW